MGKLRKKRFSKAYTTQRGRELLLIRSTADDVQLYYSTFLPPPRILCKSCPPLQIIKSMHTLCRPSKGFSVWILSALYGIFFCKKLHRRITFKDWRTLPGIHMNYQGLNIEELVELFPESSPPGGQLLQDSPLLRNFCKFLQFADA